MQSKLTKMASSADALEGGLSSLRLAADNYRSLLNDEKSGNIRWRYGGPPIFDTVNKLFEEERTHVIIINSSLVCLLLYHNCGLFHKIILVSSNNLKKKSIIYNDHHHIIPDVTDSKHILKNTTRLS